MEREHDAWQSRLPGEWQMHVCWPVRMESHHDDGVPASKWRGYDAQGLLCYYRHHFSQWDYSFDEDDEPCMRMLRNEDFEAWRCLDGNWLRRVQTVDGPGRCEGRAHDSGFEVVSPQLIPRL